VGETLNSAIVIRDLGTLICRVPLARFVPAVDYSRLAADYDAVRGSEDLDRAYWFAALAEVGHLQPGERILDLGAGTGRFSRFAAERGPVVAVDCSWDMLLQAHRKGPFARVRGDAHALPFQRDAFDLTFLVMVLHQLSDYRRALREVARVSQRVVVATSDMASRSLGILDEAFPNLLAIDRARFPPIRGIIDALRDAGFARVEAEERPYRRTLTVEQELDRVSRKYISTLDLLPPGEFERGLAFLRRELPRCFPGAFDVSSAFTFVGASR
jgi:ubiquinone/menaquinone biosynthesis C-methylase UbiE